MELITMLGGSLTGFIFKFMAERSKEKDAQFTRMMSAIDKSEAGHNAAVERVSVDAGKIIRRIIVISILFAVILAPFIMALLDHPVIVQETIQKPTYFFGLFGGGTQSHFIELKGYLMVEEVRQTLTALVGFYFGTAAAKS